MKGFSKRKKMHSLCCLALLLALVMSLAAYGRSDETQTAAAETETITAQNAEANEADGKTNVILDGFRKTMIEEDRWKDMLRGFGMTLSVLFLSVLFAVFLGVVMFALDYFGGKFWEKFFAYFSALFLRMPTPTWMFIILFAFFRGDHAKGFPACIISLGVCFGFSVFGFIKGGVASISKGQKEAAASMGYGKYNALMKIYLPQAMPGILGSFQESIFGFLATTSVAGMLYVTDLQTAASAISTETMMPLFPLLIAAVAYILFGELAFRAFGALKNKLCPPELSEEKLKEKLMKGESR